RTATSTSDIWIYDLVRGTRDRITSGKSYDWLPAWSADGSRIIFSSNRDGNFYNLYRKASSGAGSDELVFQSEEQKSAMDWSRDGRFLIYSVTAKGMPNSRESTHDIWFLPLTPGEPKPQPYIKTEFNESQGRFSPDGRYVAYRSDASGKDEIYVQPFPDPSK